jgi:hypothetical protein
MIWGLISPAHCGDRGAKPLDSQTAACGRSCWLLFCVCIYVCMVFFLLMFYPFCRVEDQRAPYPQVKLCTRIKTLLGTIMPLSCTPDTLSYTESVSAVIEMGVGSYSRPSISGANIPHFFTSIVH